MKRPRLPIMKLQWKQTAYGFLNASKDNISQHDLL